MAGNSLVLSGLIAPVIGALWAALIFTLTYVFSTDIWQAPSAALALFMITFVSAVVVCFVLTWTIGLVWRLTALRHNWLSFGAYVAAGTIVGLLIAAIPAIALPAPAQNIMYLILYLTSCAIVVSATGWLIRRPDRDAPNPDRATS
jgi:hypothetical protein